MAAAGVPTTDQRLFLIERLRRRGVSARTTAELLSHAVDGVSLRTTKSATMSRLGGDAPLLPGEAWPVNRRNQDPMTLVAVFDLAELHAPLPLPPDGRLVLFWDAVGADKGSDAWLDVAANASVRWLAPEVSTVDVPVPAAAWPFAPVSVKGVVTPIIGGIDFQLGEPLPGSARSVAIVDDMIFPFAHAAYSSDQLLGASQDIQGPVLEEIAYWFRHTSNADSRARYTADERKGKGWSLLAQVASTGGKDFRIDDYGNVSFAVPTADLYARRFDRAVAIFQSS
ncbi:MAG: DUF1963 domain-containing protein [Patulibacter minatonensis]